MVALLWPDFLAFLAFVTPVVPSEVPFLLATAACKVAFGGSGRRRAWPW